MVWEHFGKLKTSLAVAFGNICRGPIALRGGLACSKMQKSSLNFTKVNQQLSDLYIQKWLNPSNVVKDIPT